MGVQVVLGNDATFKSVRTVFESLTAELMPAKRISLALVAEHAHEGVQLRLHSGAGVEAAGAAGSSSLQELSGGQRTLVALALILAVCLLVCAMQVESPSSA